MSDQAMDRKLIRWVIGGLSAILVMVLVVVSSASWLKEQRPSEDVRTKNITELMTLLFTLPDPRTQMIEEHLAEMNEELESKLAQAGSDAAAKDAVIEQHRLTSEEKLKAALKEAGPESDVRLVATPYCTERGLEMFSHLNTTLSRACEGTGQTTEVQSVTLGERDDTGNYPFTVAFVLHTPGQPDEPISFDGSVGFDEQNLVQYLHMSNYDTTGLVKRTSSLYAAGPGA